MARSKKVTTPAFPFDSEIFSDVRNLTKLAEGRVNCEILHKDFGWIPYTACPSDDAEGSKFILGYVEVNQIDIDSLEEDPAVVALAKSVARSQRDAELVRADAIINKIEDGEIEGEVSEWRKYRVALRKWPEADDFPSDTSRPQAPDNQ